MHWHDGTSPQARRDELAELIASLDGVAPDDGDEPDASGEVVSQASFAQQRFWFFDRLTGGTDISYNIPIALRILGPLDVAALELAASRLVARHDVLRTRFAMHDDQVVQVTTAMPVLDFSKLDVEEDLLPPTLQQLERHRFDLGTGPLLRMALLRVRDRLHVLSINVHHAACDGWSISILVDDLVALYEEASGGRPNRLAPLSLQYGDFAAWQRRAFGSGTWREQLDYWVKTLRDAPALLTLPTDRPRPVRKSLDGARVAFRIDDGLAARLARLAAREGATPFMVHLAAFHLLLRRLSGQADTPIGTPIGSRSRVELEPLIGCFVNTLVLRVASTSTTSVRKLLAEVKRVSVGAFAHQDLPFEVLVEELRPARTLSHTPVFQVLFAYQNVPRRRAAPDGLDIDVLPQTFDFGVSRFDLTLNVSERESGTIGYLEYSKVLFDGATIEAHVGSYLTLLEAFSDADRDGTLDAAFDPSFVPGGDPLSSQESLAHWRSCLAAPLPVLELPVERKARERDGRPDSASLDVPLAASLVDDCRAFARQKGASLEVVLLAAYLLLLRRITRQADLLVLVSLHDRSGVFPLRLDFSGLGGFGTLVTCVKERIDAASEHRSAFEQLAASVVPDLNIDRHPAFGVRFDMGTGDAMARTLGDAGARDELLLQAREDGDGAYACFHYFLRATGGLTMRALPELFVRLLDGALVAPDIDPLRLPLLAEDERRRILDLAWGRQALDVPYSTLAQPFEEQVQRTPHAVALVGEEGEMCYLELDRAANRLAHHMSACGVATGSVVGVCMERSFGMVVALYAVAKLGATYVPVDPEQPAQRLSFMLDESGATLVLVHAATRALVPAGRWVPLDLDSARRMLEAEPHTPLPCEPPPNNLAYLMYTSGSTGRPKAVAYPVDAVLLCTFWLQREFPIAPGEAHLFKTPFGFDVSTWEVFWSLYFGGRLVVSLPGGHCDPRYLFELIEEHEVVSANFVPTMLQAFLDELPGSGRCPALRWILCGGEPMTPRLRDSFFERQLSARLVNLAGATETHTVVRNVIEPRPGDAYVPLGKPAADYRLYVLDEHLEPVPPGVVGEWYIGGRIGLAHGYHARPALTAEKFLPDPYGPPGERMYRTGDLCRCADDGTLEHLGREDSQIKLRGLRVDLAEIEQVLAEHADVHSCIALPIGSDTSMGQIVAFVVVSGDIRIDAAALLAHCRARLPRGMVPAGVVQVDCIPATPNGKADRRALAALWEAAPKVSDEKPTPAQGPVEEQLKAIFQEVLQAGDISVTTSFFDLGGHSLLAFKLTSACEQAFGVEVPIIEVFSHSSVRDLAAWIGTAESPRDPCLVPLAPSDDKPLLVCIHAASGTVLPFQPLAAALADEFSVLGLQAPGADGTGTPPDSIADYAHRYTLAVDTVRGSRAVTLVGWSMGGNIAVEMARQWQEAGVFQAMAVVLLDTTVTGVQGEADLRRLRLEEELARRELAALEEVVSGNAQPVRSIQGLKDTLDANFATFRREPAPRWFDGKVELLVASATASSLDTSVEPDLGWRPHVRQLGVSVLTGTHFDLLSPPRVPALAAALRSITTRHH